MILKVSLDESGRYLRNNGGMPRTVHPDLPDDTERAIDILGNRVRFAIVRSLLIDGPATRTGLSDRLGVSMSLLQKHLALLEEQGAVNLSPPRSVPGVRPRAYSVEPRTIALALSSLAESLRP